MKFQYNIAFNGSVIVSLDSTVIINVYNKGLKLCARNMPKEIPINQLILSTNYKLNENNRLNDLILVTITAHTQKISFPL